MGRLLGIVAVALNAFFLVWNLTHGAFGWACFNAAGLVAVFYGDMAKEGD